MVKGLGISEVRIWKMRDRGVFATGIDIECGHFSNGESRNMILKELLRYLPMT